MKAVIDDDPDNSALQRLRFYVDVNGNSAFDESTEKFLDTTLVDDDWSAGYMGLYRHNTVSAATLFDSFKAGFDNNADGDIDDGGDKVIIDDDFNSTTMSLAYDNDGNCTNDGVFKYVYDACSRLVSAAANATTVTTYEYSGSHSRMTHVITNTGVENQLGDGGARESRFYYAQGGLAEERNGSGQLVRAYAWGSQGADLVWVELNGDPTIGNDSNPDNTTGGRYASAEYDTSGAGSTDENWAAVGGMEGEYRLRRSTWRRTHVVRRRRKRIAAKT